MLPKVPRFISLVYRKIVVDEDSAKPEDFEIFFVNVVNLSIVQTKRIRTGRPLPLQLLLKYSLFLF